MQLDGRAVHGEGRDIIERGDGGGEGGGVEFATHGLPAEAGGSGAVDRDGDRFAHGRAGEQVDGARLVRVEVGDERAADEQGIEAVGGEVGVYGTARAGEGERSAGAAALDAVGGDGRENIRLQAAERAQQLVLPLERRAGRKGFRRVVREEGEGQGVFILPEREAAAALNGGVERLDIPADDVAHAEEGVRGGGGAVIGRPHPALCEAEGLQRGVHVLVVDAAVVRDAGIAEAERAVEAAVGRGPNAAESAAGIAAGGVHERLVGAVVGAVGREALVVELRIHAPQDDEAVEGELRRRQREQGRAQQARQAREDMLRALSRRVYEDEGEQKGIAEGEPVGILEEVPDLVQRREPHGGCQECYQRGGGQAFFQRYGAQEEKGRGEQRHHRAAEEIGEGGGGDGGILPRQELAQELCSEICQRGVVRRGV